MVDAVEARVRIVLGLIAVVSWAWNEIDVGVECGAVRGLDPKIVAAAVMVVVVAVTFVAAMVVVVVVSLDLLAAL